MGRYYNGDIEGKFWFGIQSSTDASFFGGEEYEPNYLNYYFETSDMDDIEEGIKKCEEVLGKDEKKLDKFFDKNNGYNDIMLEKEFGWDKDTIREKLEYYARVRLGRKIRECVKRRGICEFQAEL